MSSEEGEGCTVTNSGPWTNKFDPKLGIVLSGGLGAERSHASQI